MKKQILTFTASLFLSSLLYADSVTIQNGWSLLGATEDIDVTKFDNTCVDFVWKYSVVNSSNPIWQVHIANGQNYEVPSEIGQLQGIKKGEGYWVKGNGSCVIDLNNQNIELDAKEIMAGKTFYYKPEGYDSILLEETTINSDATEAHWKELIVTDGNTPEEGDVKITNINGNYVELYDEDENENFNLSIIEKTDDYIVVVFDENGIQKSEVWFFDKTKAESYYSLNTDLDAKEILAGKTFYYTPVDYDDILLEETTINSDATEAHWKELIVKDGEAGEEGDVKITSINGNHLEVYDEDDDEEFEVSIIEKTDDYIVVLFDREGSETPEIWFFDKEKAEEYLSTLNN